MSRVVLSSMAQLVMTTGQLDKLENTSEWLTTVWLCIVINKHLPFCH